LEDPQWYTPYTPYQAEVSQGRLTALLNFQTMVTDLTGMEITNASMLDEATAAAEAMTMCLNIKGHDKPFVVSDKCHPQTIALIQSRAEPIGVKVIVTDLSSYDYSSGICGAISQYPDTYGNIEDLEPLIVNIHTAGGLAVVATDLLALTILRSPGSFGADIVVGTTQRFGVPLGFGGPHAGFLATLDCHKRQIAGRLVGVSKDADGHPAVRLTMQTREQHIRREKATSNICTAQALLANVSAFYAMYHGPSGLTAIANRVRSLTASLALTLQRHGHEISSGPLFDTLLVHVQDSDAVIDNAVSSGINLRQISKTLIGISLDETTSDQDLADLLSIFSINEEVHVVEAPELPASLQREKPILEHPVFNKYHSETEMMRYLSRLGNLDISLANSMIPLGSCTMKLNAASEMIPIS